MADTTLTEADKSLFLEAVYEIDKLSRILPDLAPLDDGQAHYAVKGVAGRLLRLSGAIMELLNGDDADRESAERVINFGQTGPG
jgi:hypothetical protein